MASSSPITSLLASSTSTTPLSSFNYKISVKLDDKKLSHLVTTNRTRPPCSSIAPLLHLTGDTSGIPLRRRSPQQCGKSCARSMGTSRPALAFLVASFAVPFYPSQCHWLSPYLPALGFDSPNISILDQGSDFLAKVKSISDSLLSIGESVSTQDQLDVILEGLPSEFGSLTTAINSKLDWFDLDVIKALLLAHEQRIAKQRIGEEVATLNVTQPVTNSDSTTAANPNSQSLPQANYMNPNLGNTQNQGFQQNSRGNSNARGRGGRFGRHDGRGGGRSTTQCQVCYRFEHEASYCYHRYNTAYGPPTPYQNGNPYQYQRPGAPNPNTWPAQNPQNHQNFVVMPQAQANYTNTYVAPMDTAASHHVTTLPAPSGAQPPPSHLENVFLGNGQGF